MRNITKTIVIVGLLAPSGAQTLGIGDIKLHSFLNQPLNAEIPLVLSGEQLSQLKIALATPNEFSKAGLEHSPSLTKLRFETRQKADGTFAIHIRSLAIIPDPFLSFVLELTWPEGRMLRSFTVLLDPPDVLKPHSRIADATEFRGDSDEGRLAAPDSERQSSRSPRADEKTGGQTIAPVGPSEAPYGPVGRNETLWKIAERLNKDPAITTEQMVLALFRLNPQAFNRSNVNSLNAGAYLRIPDRDHLQQVSPSSAREDFYQYEAERRGRLQKQSSYARQPRAAGLTDYHRQPKFEEPAEPASNRFPASPKDSDDTQAVEKLRRENEQIRNRVATLERRVTELTRILDERTALRAAPPPIQPLPPLTAESSGIVASESPIPGGRLAARDTEAGSPRVEAEGPASAVQDTANAMTDRTTVYPVTAEPTPTISRKPEASPSAPIQAVYEPTPAAGPKQAETKDLAESNSWLWWIGSSSAVAAALTGVFLRRRFLSSRSTRESQPGYEQETATVKAMARTAPAGLINPAVTGQTEANPKPAAPDSPAIREAVAVERVIEDVDALFEADIYLSYGKYRQAEESIRKAIERAPDRSSHYLKLLEVYAAGKQFGAFANCVNALKSEHRFDEPDFWARVTTLEQQLNGPRNGEQHLPLATGENAGPSLDPGDETDHLIAKLKQFSLETENPTAGAPPEASVDTSGLADPARLPAAETPASLSDPQASSKFGPALPPPEKTAGIPAATSDPDKLIAYKAPQLPKTEAAVTDFNTDAAKSIEDLLKELSAMHFEEHLNATTPSDTDSRVPRNENAPCGEFGTPEPAEGAGTVSDKAGITAEVTTHEPGDLESKLDLARAYADMADYAQARAMLIEVLKDGTAQQRHEAEALLSRLA